jgi:hypothetical protein
MKSHIYMKSHVYLRMSPPLIVVVSDLVGGGRGASRVVFGIGRCGGCGDGGGVAPRVAMVDGVEERERLHEGCRLRTMSGGVGGRRVRPRWAGRKYYLLCESFVSDSVTGEFYVRST